MALRYPLPSAHPAWALGGGCRGATRGRGSAFFNVLFAKATDLRRPLENQCGGRGTRGFPRELELAWCPRQKAAYRVSIGGQPPVTAVSFSSHATPHVSLGWNAVRSTGTHRHGPRGGARPPGRPSGPSRLGTPKTRSGPAIRPPSHPWAEWGSNLPPPAPPDLVAAQLHIELELEQQQQQQ